MQSKPRHNKEHRTAIIAASIGAAGAIIAALISTHLASDVSSPREEPTVPVDTVSRVSPLVPRDSALPKGLAPPQVQAQAPGQTSHGLGTGSTSGSQATADEPRTRSADFGPVTIALERCNRRGSVVRCDLLFTNHSDDRYIRLFARGGLLFGPTRMIDQSGNEYHARILQLARDRSSDEVWATLVSNIPTRGWIEFHEIPDSASSIALLEIQLGDSENFGTVSFRNTPLSLS